jgi:hypothetical protein
MNELSQLLEDLITCGNTLIQTAQSLKDFYSQAEENVPEKPADKTPKKKETASKPQPPAEEPAKTYTKEEVRALLAKKANENGGAYKSAVKELVKKYGNGGSLTNVKPEDYPALVAEMEAVSNAG